MLYISETPTMGRGVFSDVPIPKDATIEICPMLPIPKGDVLAIKSTCLDNYLFDWQDTLALAFGNGMLYNHSLDPNCELTEDFEQSLMIYTALRNIPAGEEICYDYSAAGREILFPKKRHWIYADTMNQV